MSQKQIVKSTPLPLIILIIATLAMVCYTLWQGQTRNAAVEPTEEAYAAAVADAATIEPGEILPVISLAQDSEMATWDANQEKLLLLTWHKYPESYPAGETVTLDWGEVWTFTEKEMQDWYQANGADVENWQSRLSQLLGMPPDTNYTHVSAFWVDPQDVVRPAYTTDITATEMSDHFATEPDSTYKTWFDGNIIYSYYDSDYPWTRLGYTYDWGARDTEYGLSEFLVRQGATVNVEYTMTTEEFIQSLAAAEEQAA